ncbi:MAG: DNA-binding protein [Spongiibacteraceae bacterium]|jgi:antitoxin FitA|nr:DNA-binding protein [Spongiibacteraceae bacterium]
MAAITIKNIPDDLYAHLKQAAKAHHRSVNSELIACLERVLLPSKASPAERLNAARALRSRATADVLSADGIDDAKREGRP